MKESKRPKSCSNGEIVDRISNLPDDVLHQILSHLPIREAGRTCVLSSRWRFQMAMLPDLVFGREHSSSFVDHVLLSHIGPVTKFELTQGDLDNRDLDRWIYHLSRYPLRVFKLDIWIKAQQSQQPYKMPLCIFSYQDIICLKLRNCLLKPPATFKGFRFLKSLDIERVTIAQDVLENLTLCCPLLERFTLCDCHGFRHFKIDAPNLQFLDVSGYFDFSIVNALNLVDVSLYLGDTPWSSSKINFFDNLPCIQRLRLNWEFVKNIAAGALLELPKPCRHLKFLEIEMCLVDLEDILCALCLLRSSPALEVLNIVTSYGSPNTAYEATVRSCLDNYQTCSFTQLRHVKIYDIFGLRGKLDFIRFLLLCSPVLEKLTVDCVDVGYELDVSLELVKKLLRMKRASSNLEIVYLDK